MSLLGVMFNIQITAPHASESIIDSEFYHSTKKEHFFTAIFVNSLLVHRFRDKRETTRREQRREDYLSALIHNHLQSRASAAMGSLPDWARQNKTTNSNNDNNQLEQLHHTPTMDSESISSIDGPLSRLESEITKIKNESTCRGPIYF